MGYFQVRYDSRVVIYERKMFIRLATGHLLNDQLYFLTNFRGNLFVSLNLN